MSTSPIIANEQMIQGHFVLRDQVAVNYGQQYDALLVSIERIFYFSVSSLTKAVLSSLSIAQRCHKKRKSNFKLRPRNSLRNWFMNEIQFYSNEYVSYCFISYVFSVCVLQRTGWLCNTSGKIQTQADFLVSNHNRHVAAMAVTYKHTNALRQND